MSLYLEKDEDIVASFGEFLLSLKLSLLSKKDGSDLKIRKVKSCPQMAQTCCSNAVTSRTGAIELCTKNMCSKQKQVAFRHDFKIFIWLLTYNFLSLSSNGCTNVENYPVHRVSCVHIYSLSNKHVFHLVSAFDADTHRRRWTLPNQFDDATSVKIDIQLTCHCRLSLVATTKPHCKALVKPGWCS